MMSLVLSRKYLTFQRKKFKGKKINSKLGLPQGSVIAALLFILFIADWNMRVTSEKSKFADDGTIWITGKDWHELVESRALGNAELRVLVRTFFPWDA